LKDNIPTDDIRLVEKLNETVRNIKQEIGKVIIGQDIIIDQLIVSLLSKGHCLLIGVPGLAKTLLIKTLAEVMDLNFNRIQFTPDLMPSDITGTEIIEEDPLSKKRNFRFIPGPVFANVILADEINRTPPKTQSALLEAMQEHKVTTAGTTYTLSEPFFVLATQNPIEQEGTYPLPEAQLDRFLLKIVVDYPNEREERALLSLVTQGRIGDVLDVESLATLVTPETIQSLQRLAAAIRIEDRVRDYAVSIVRATRQWPGIQCATMAHPNAFLMQS